LVLVVTTCDNGGWCWFAVAYHMVCMSCKHPVEHFRWREYAAWFLNTLWGIGHNGLPQDVKGYMVVHFDGSKLYTQNNLRYNNVCNKEQGTGTAYDRYWRGTNVLGFGIAWKEVSLYSYYITECMHLNKKCMKYLPKQNTNKRAQENDIRTQVYVWCK
jgi:hypothetical protein